MNMRKALDRLKAEYAYLATRELRAEFCPAKQSFTLKTDELNLPETYVNVMGAKLSDGYCGSKTIYVNEKFGTSSAHVIVLDKDGRTVFSRSAAYLTAIRSALMAALAWETLAPYSYPKKIGFIGLGKMNQRASEVFVSLWPDIEFVLLGRRKNTDHDSRLMDGFDRLGFPATRCHMSTLSFRECDMIVSATNNFDKHATFCLEQFANLNHPKHPRLFVAQDGGYIFGETFRRHLNLASDHPEQIAQAYSSEYPWDLQKHEFRGLHDFGHVQPGNRQYFVALYGIATADLVVALEEIGL